MFAVELCRIIPPLLHIVMYRILYRGGVIKAVLRKEKEIMNESTKTKKALRGSLLALFLCIVLLIGTTFAWFTDTASTGVNKIQSGNLDVKLLYSTDDGDTWHDAEGQTLKFLQKQANESLVENADILWEPGCTYKLPQIKVKNNGNLALKYTMKVTGVEGDQKLNEVIDWTIDDKALTDFDGSLTAGESSNAMTIQGHMQESAGNEYQNLSIDGISITVYATQAPVENDSFDNQYDASAQVKAVGTENEIAEAMKTADTVVTVTKNIKPENTLVADQKNVTLNMNGKTFENTVDLWNESTASWSLVSAQKGSSLTIDGNGTFKAKANDCFAVDVQDGSKVVIKNGTFVGNVHAVYVYEGTAIIEGGTYSVQQKYQDAAKADEFVLNCYDANRANGTAKIIVKGGTFINFNPADCQAEGAHTNFVADDYKVTSEKKGNDIYYTVVKK